MAYGSLSVKCSSLCLSMICLDLCVMIYVAFNGVEVDGS